MLLTAATLLVAACAGISLAPAPAKAGNRTLPPGTIYERSAPGAPFPAPADGRINGPGFQAQVTGIATGPGFGSGSDSEPAPSGDHVLAFSFAWHPGMTYVVGSSPFEADVAVAGQRLALPAQDDRPGASSIVLVNRGRTMPLVRRPPAAVRLGTWLLGAALLTVWAVARATGKGRHGSGSDNERLHRLAEEISRDPSAGRWVEKTRRALADGSLGDGWGPEELRARLAERAASS